MRCYTTSLASLSYLSLSLKYIFNVPFCHSSSVTFADNETSDMGLPIRLFKVVIVVHLDQYQVSNLNSIVLPNRSHG